MSVSDFKTDGCSGGMSAFWKRQFGTVPPWENCCIEHDRAYHAGGTSDQRKEADYKLYQCVKANKGTSWAWIMWLAVRFGGVPYMPWDWRWGYGRDYAMSYWYDKTNDIHK